MRTRILRKLFSGERISQNLELILFEIRRGFLIWFPRAGGVWGGMRAGAFLGGGYGEKRREMLIYKSTT
jgi:hypothetical protein